MVMKSYDKVKSWRYKSRIKALESFGSKCGICGYDKCNRALSLHHIDQNEKEISFSGICQSWKKMVTEMRKCVLLCANCHMEVHDGITEIPDDIKRFDESFAVYTNIQGKVIGE